MYYYTQIGNKNYFLVLVLTFLKLVLILPIFKVPKR